MPQLSGGRFVFNRRRQLWVLSSGVFKIDIQLIRNHLGNAVGIAITPCQHPRDIANHRLRSQRAERDNVANRTLAIFLPDILNHFTATRLAEIDVNIRRTDPLRIQKPFKQQIEWQWIKIRNAKTIRHQRPRRRPPARPDRNSLVLRPLNEIPDNEKIRKILHLLQDRNLVVKPRPQRLIPRGPLLPITIDQPRFANAAEIRLPRTAVRRAKLRVLGRTRRIKMQL